MNHALPPASVVPTVAMCWATILALAAWDLGTGRYPMALSEAWAVLAGYSDNPQHRFVVEVLRLPRLLLAVTVGAALAVSGVLLQTLMRNALAAPGLVGINGGATVVILALVLLVPGLATAWYPLAAFAGALTAGALVYTLARRQGEVSAIGFLLIGVGVAAFCGGLTTILTTMTDAYDAQAALVWLVGSLHGRSWPQWYAAVGVVVPLLLVAWSNGRNLDAFALGRDTAVAIGVAFGLRLWCLLLVSVGLAASAVAAVGALGFVGLMSPHIARRLVGGRHHRLVPAAASIGALLVLLADVAGRSVSAVVQVPAGIVIALVGVPFFLYLLWRRPAV